MIKVNDFAQGPPKFASMSIFLHFQELQKIQQSFWGQKETGTLNTQEASKSRQYGKSEIILIGKKSWFNFFLDGSWFLKRY